MVLWLVGDGQVVSLLATVKFLKWNQWILSKLVYITKLILRAWTGPNTHKNSSKATTIAASPVYEVIPPLLRSLRDLLGASILSSFICSGRPQGESLHFTARSKFIIICSCSRLYYSPGGFLPPCSTGSLRSSDRWLSFARHGPRPIIIF